MNTNIAIALLIGLAVAVVYYLVTHKEVVQKAVAAETATLRVQLASGIDSLHKAVGMVHQATMQPVSIALVPTAPVDAPPAAQAAPAAPAAAAAPAATPAKPSPVVFDPAQGYEAFAAFRAQYPVATEIFSPRGYPLDVRGQEIDPAAYQVDMSKRDIAAGQWWGYEFQAPGQMISPTFSFAEPVKREVIFGFDLGRGISASITNFGPVAGGDVIDLPAGTYQVLLTATHPGSTSFMLNKA